VVCGRGLLTDSATGVFSALFIDHMRSVLTATEWLLG